MSPCYDESHQTGTMIVAILYMVGSLIFIVNGILGIVGGTILGLTTGSFNIKINGEEIAYGERIHIHDEKTVGAFAALIVIVSFVRVVLYAVNLLIAILLFVGAAKRNRTICIVWFVINVIVFVIRTIDSCFELSEGPEIALIVRTALMLLMEVYLMCVVWAFMSELKEGPGPLSKPYGNSGGPVPVHHGNFRGHVHSPYGNTRGPVPTPDYDNTRHPVGNWQK